MIHLSSFLAGFFLDWLFGDPKRLPHPVRILGKIAAGLEKILRALFRSDKFSGILYALLLIVGVGLGVYFSLSLLSRHSHVAAWIFEVLLVFYALSVKSLAQAARWVARALRAQNLTMARRYLSEIVGRDTKQLNDEEVTRACVETVAESTLDGIISPIFYFCLGGPVWMWVYKTVNTLDSMVGYRNERYERFGWLSARLDDAFNFIPSRLSPFLISLASFFLRLPAARSLKCGFTEGSQNPSPNAGYPEAAFAGALGIGLGGLNFYEGRAMEKPRIGLLEKELAVVDIDRAVRLSQATSILCLIFGGIILWISRG